MAPKKTIQAFVLPNGNNLSYAWPHQAKGGQFQWHQSYLTDKLIHHKAKAKERQIRIGLWTSRSTTHAICADFDNLPAGFDDWECFHKFAKMKWGNEGFIYRSFHKKLKIIFIGKLDEKARMCKVFALNFLKEKLGFEFYDYVDKNHGAVSTSFISGTQVSRLHDWLPKAKVFSIDTTVVEHKYLQATEIPPELKIFIENGGKSQLVGREKFIRMLLKMNNLNLNGFDLPTTKIGKECGVIHVRVSEWRNELIQMGWLKLTDDNYCKGIKGMTYKARGALRKAIYAVVAAVKKSFKLDPSKLPSIVSDGEWENTMWEYSKYFTTKPEAFLRWALNLPHVRYKRRFKKAFRAINSRLKYARLEPLPIPRRI